MTFRYRHVKWDPDHPDPAAQFLALPDPIRTGTLRFFGHWIGRPMDSIETPVAAFWKADCLTIHFKDYWCLEVWDPKDFVIDGRLFAIGTASRVRYVRSLWDPEPEDPNLTRSFALQNGVLTAEYGDGSPILDAKRGEPAVEIN